MTTNREAQISQLIDQIGRNANAAADLLALAAEYLEAGEPLPGKLACFLAASFRLAVSEPCAERGSKLAVELGLSAPGKEGRPEKDVDYAELKEIIDHEFSENGGISESKLKELVAKKFDVSQGTALKHIKPAIFIPKLLKNNELKSLVRPRKSKV